MQITAALGFLRLEGEDHIVMHRLVNAFTQSVLAEGTSAVATVEATLNRLLTAVWDKNLHLGQLPMAASQLRHVTEKALLRRDLMAANLANHLGRHLLDNYAMDNAKSYLADALSIRQELLGDVCRHLGKYDHAANHLIRAMHIHEAVGEQCDEMVETLLLLTDYYLEVSDLPQAKAVLDKNLAICAEMIRQTHPFVGRIYLRLGEYYLQSGEPEMAHSFFGQANEILSTAVAPMHLDLIRLQKHPTKT
jgi:tetratricopeptide (TPR) repeat protein